MFAKTQQTDLAHPLSRLRFLIFFSCGSLRSPSLQKIKNRNYRKTVTPAHWYVSYRRLVRAFPQVEYEYRIVRPPKLNGKSAEALKGDWFLGVLKGSPNPARGAWVASSLSAQATSHAIHTNDLGLPPHKILLHENLNRKVFMPLYGESWSRREIKDYHAIRFILLDGLSAIFRDLRRTEKTRGASDISAQKQEDLIPEKTGRKEKDPISKKIEPLIDELNAQLMEHWNSRRG